MIASATQRKLTVILIAEIKGYSKLMQEDDESIVNTIAVYRKITTASIPKHQGQLISKTYIQACAMVPGIDMFFPLGACNKTAALSPR